MNKKIIYLVVGIIIVIIALFVFNDFLSNEVIEKQVEEQPVVDIISINNLIVPDQAAETEIFVEKVLLKSNGFGGFVVIRREGTASTTTVDELGNIIGVSRYIEPGITDNLIVNLKDEEVVGVGENFIATLYSDDGDKLWNKEIDMQIINGEGLPVEVSFVIMSQGDIDIGPKL